jgi:hypothetical protein
MKLIMFVVGLGALLAISGCESPEHEWHEHHRGGTYDHNYRGYGHDSYDYGREGYRYDNDRYWDREYRYH